MSLMEERLRDPTRTAFMEDHYERRFLRPLVSLEATVLAQMSLDMLELALGALVAMEAMWTDLAEEIVEMSARRGATFAAYEVNRLGPDYQVSPDDRYPADRELLESLTEEAVGYVHGFAADLRNETAGIISDGVREGLSAAEISERVSEAVGVSRARATAIARTTVIRGFNEAARRRYRQWGVKKYRYYTNLDPKVCREPKRLRDGTVVQGCESLHGTEWSITDITHLPPIHPLCRCTILPVLER